MKPTTEIYKTILIQHADKTLREVGEMLGGLTRERVRQLYILHGINRGPSGIMRRVNMVYVKKLLKSPQLTRGFVASQLGVDYAGLKVVENRIGKTFFTRKEYRISMLKKGFLFCFGCRRWLPKSRFTANTLSRCAKCNSTISMWYYASKKRERELASAKRRQ